MLSHLHVPCHTDGSTFSGLRGGFPLFIFMKDQEKNGENKKRERERKKPPIVFVGSWGGTRTLL